MFACVVEIVGGVVLAHLRILWSLISVKKDLVTSTFQSNRCWSCVPLCVFLS